VAGGHRAVALDAADAVLDPRGGVTVGRRVVVFPVAGHVAWGAHGIPIHAAARPVAPLAGAAMLVAKDIEPLAPLHVEGEVGRLPAAARRRDQRLPERPGAEDERRRVGDARFARAHLGEARAAIGPGECEGGAAGGRVRMDGECISVTRGIDRTVGQRVIGVGPGLEDVRMAFAARGGSLPRAGHGGRRRGAAEAGHTAEQQQASH
jgi:hypothetical protein